MMNSIRDEHFALKDGRKILLFNTKGRRVNVPSKVKEFLNYIETKRSTNEFTDKLDVAVRKARQNKEWRLEYMKTLLHDMDVRLEGKAEGRIELLVTQTIKKLQKGKPIDKIAEELEESVEYIQNICDIAVRDDINCDVDKILKEMLEN